MENHAWRGDPKGSLGTERAFSGGTLCIINVHIAICSSFFLKRIRECNTLVKNHAWTSDPKGSLGIERAFLGGT